MHRVNTALSRIAVGVTFVWAMALSASMLIQPACAQTYTVIHDFAGGADGDEPAYGLTIDASGTLYGVTFEGDAGTGTLFKLRQLSSGWHLTPLYVFPGGPGTNGAVSYSGVSFGLDSTLYGTTGFGGVGPCSTWGGTDGCGTVFTLKPSLSACRNALCYWTETPINDFTGGSNGATPFGGRLTFDGLNNIYGTTFSGGGGNCPGGCGVVYQLVHSGGSWTENVLYTFTGSGGDGAYPFAGVIFDQVGNLFGTTTAGGTFGYGTVYELSQSPSGWTQRVIYNFQNQADGGSPFAGLIIDRAGNLYGATTSGGSAGNGGTVFELSPAGSGWTLQTLASFVRNPGELAGGPVATPIMDSAGNIYGATYGDGANGVGSVFKLSPSGGGWTLTTLYDFVGGSTGLLPRSNLVMDSAGNLYGMAAAGGAFGKGAVFQITP
ncbi:MAG TPA: choice-of-anchor tandem repeat GloVer-containing protein [Candidatus Binatia bacterium]|nr:choice-of-anchor tandem repeat GloVer-containing protein [Candidatus Binatia bacterium]